MSTAKVFGQDLGLLRESNLLAALSEQITNNTGGPPALGAIPQDDGLSSFVWSDVVGHFLGDELGNQLVDEDGNILIG